MNRRLHWYVNSKTQHPLKQTPAHCKNAVLIQFWFWILVWFDPKYWQSILLQRLCPPRWWYSYYWRLFFVVVISLMKFLFNPHDQKMHESMCWICSVLILDCLYSRLKYWLCIGSLKILLVQPSTWQSRFTVFSPHWLTTWTIPPAAFDTKGEKRKKKQLRGVIYTPTLLMKPVHACCVLAED